MTEHGDTMLWLLRSLALHEISADDPGTVDEASARELLAKVQESAILNHVCHVDKSDESGHTTGRRNTKNAKPRRLPEKSTENQTDYLRGEEGISLADEW